MFESLCFLLLSLLLLSSLPCIAKHPLATKSLKNHSGLALSSMCNKSETLHKLNIAAKMHIAYVYIHYTIYIYMYKYSIYIHFACSSVVHTNTFVYVNWMVYLYYMHSKIRYVYFEKFRSDKIVSQTVFYIHNMLLYT